MSIRRSFLVMSVLFLASAACSSNNDGDAATGSATPTSSPTAEATESSASTPTETPTSAGRTELESEDSALGMILTDGSGNTLYAFQPDAQGPSTCYDDCASSWPALLVKGELEVSGNDEDPTDARLLDTTARDDGGAQVTYNGWPLYYFAGDEAPGDTNGQGVSDVWYVISPEGDPITT